MMRLPGMKPMQASLPILLCIWWLANNVYAIDAERFFTRFPSALLYVDLTLCQILLGAALTQVYLLYGPSPPTAASQSPVTAHSMPTTPTLLPSVNATSTLRGLFYLPITIAALHYLATLLTNISYSELGSTTTLLWKLSEPASAALLNRLLLNESPTPTSALGVLLTLLGVYRFSASVFSLPTFSPIILSNLLFPLRNVCIKLDQSTTESNVPGKNRARAESKTAIGRFGGMLRRALPIGTAVFLVKLGVQGFDFPAITYMFRNAFLFTAYQLASFLLLEQLDALTHSLLNTLKRFSGILLSMIVLSAPLTMPQFQGIGITITGFVVYLFGRKRQKLGPSVIGLAVVSGFVVLGVIAGIGKVINFGGQDVQIDFGNVTKAVERLSEEMGSENSKAYIVMRGHDYRARRRSTTHDGYKEAFLDTVSDMGSNVGNLVWQYGAHEALPEFGSDQICEAGDRKTCAALAAQRGTKHVFYFPVADLLNPDRPEVFQQMAKSMKKNGWETLMLGLGVQFDFKEYSPRQFNSTARITTTSDDYVYPKNTKKFLQAMEEAGGIIMLRGDFALNVTRRGGFTRGFSVGCPSIWINEDVHLGKTLEEKYKAIAARRGDKSLKIAVNVKSISGFDKQIIHFRDYYPNSRFYVQSPADVKNLHNLNVPYERVRFFTNVEDWIADLREMDIGYGVRIHGNMISIAAGLPALVVASDWRVLELVRRMKIPHLTTYDPVFEEDADVAKMVDMIGFNGDEFDMNRCEIAKVYIRVFGHYGIGVRKHVREVAELC